MDRDDTVATLTSVDVGLAMSLTQERGAGWRFLARAELLAVVRALEESECQPRRVVNDCKGVVKALQAIQSGHRMPKGRHRDLEERARRALPQDCQLQWVKAHQIREAVDEGRITLEDFQGNLEADE
eukprot:2687497-Amphidinium_carterae.2